MSTPDEPDVYEAPETIIRMLFTTWSLLNSLTPELRAQAEWPMDHPGRLDWDFIPKPDRLGVPLAAMDGHQRTLAHSLLRAGLSLDGYTQALQIIAMENVLREREADFLRVMAGDFRNPDNYYFAFFGRPGFEDTWGWRVLGHHLSLSYTIVDQRHLTVTPCNLGAQPASCGVLAPLAREEDLGFALLHSLDTAQSATAVIHTVAPPDYATRQVPFVGKVEYPDYADLGIPWYQINDEDRELLKFSKDEPAGICARDLSTTQQDLLYSLVAQYLKRSPEELWTKQLDRVQAAGPDGLHFAWAGGLEKGTPHYYRIQGTHVVIEFDNAIDSGNHIHSVWRDYRNDLGHDLLREHYARERRTGHHQLNTRLTSSVPDDDR
ncbi:DUF3500 domain-containing protein [Pseudonocardia sp. CA-107938]|uniref:DUF3500 domain-containing protein n=1 Tax=Pseudonocardia sp. CA-107938 TaxID=3240021 RepID=UPI003D8B8FD6